MRRFHLFAGSLILVACLPVFAFPPIGGISNTKAPPPRPPGSMSTGAPTNHQNASEESKVEFHSETVLVQVPVVVVDKQGNHVPGLTKEDFEVLENGKAQKIATFEEFTTSTTPFTPSIGASNYFSNSRGTGGERRTTVVVLDTVNTPFLDQAYGRKELIRYLAGSLNPGQSFSLVLLTSTGLRILQAPTQDSSALLQALSRMKGELSTMEDTDINARAQGVADSASDFSPASFQASPTAVSPYAGLRDFVSNGDSGIARLQQDRAIEATMRGFLDISWALSGISGRKSLIWATGSFPFYIDSPGAIPGGHLSVLYERTMKALNDAQISVYPVDIRGLVNTSASVGANTRGRTGSAAVQQAVARNWLQGSTIDTLRDFAEMTGGRAFYNTNDIATSFQRAAADSASYYALSYYLDTADRNPGWRKLKVKVNRKAVEVRSRTGFFVTNTTVNPALTLKLDLGFAVNSPFDCTGVPLSVQWTDAPPVESQRAESRTAAGANTDRTAQKKKVGFLLRVAGNGVSIEPGVANRFNLDLIAYAFRATETGAPASFAKNFEGSFPDSQLQKFREKGFGYSQALDLTPGKYTVRFVVRDNLSGRVGSVSAPVTVD